MIRKMEKKEFLWLETNIKAHDFIPAQYWEKNYGPVREMLPQAEIYVWEEDGQIQGFAGLYEDYIAGIFVLEQAQSKGIGGQLLNYIKGRKPLFKSEGLHQKNIRAVKFYKREGFQIKKESADQETERRNTLWSGIPKKTREEIRMIIENNPKQLAAMEEFHKGNRAEGLRPSGRVCGPVQRRI